MQMKEQRSNNTNKLSPQEPSTSSSREHIRSNNTNKLSPQEHFSLHLIWV